MKNIAVILAKSKSTRLPNKNFLKFNGIPIVDNSILKALSSNMFNKIIISTDDKDYGKLFDIDIVDVYRRKQENTKDDSSMYDAIMEVLQLYHEYDTVCIIHACNPLLKSEYIIEAYDKFIDGGYDTVFPVVEDSLILRGLYANWGKVYSVDNIYDNINTQSMVKTYRHTGMFYWCNIKALAYNNSIMNDNMGFIKLSKMQCQDIDDADDWEIAKWKYDRMNKW